MDSRAYLRGLGWRGEGHSLDHAGRGLTKPLLTSRKIDVLGLGKKKHDAGDQWWMRALDSSLKDLGSGKQTMLASVQRHGAKRGGLYGFFVRGEMLQGTVSAIEGSEGTVTPVVGEADPEMGSGAGTANGGCLVLRDEVREEAVPATDRKKKRKRERDGEDMKGEKRRKRGKRQRVEPDGGKDGGNASVACEASANGKERLTREDKGLRRKRRKEERGPERGHQVGDFEGTPRTGDAGTQSRPEGRKRKRDKSSSAEAGVGVLTDISFELDAAKAVGRRKHRAKRKDGSEAKEKASTELGQAEVAAVRLERRRQRERKRIEKGKRAGMKSAAVDDEAGSMATTEQAEKSKRRTQIKAVKKSKGAIMQPS